MNDEIDYSQKISNFNKTVGNNNEDIAIEFLSLANWDETQAIKLYLNNVSLPNNSNIDNNNTIFNYLSECTLNLNFGFVKKTFSLFKSKLKIDKDNHDYCKFFEGEIPGLIKDPNVFMNSLKINKGVIILYNLVTLKKLMKQIDEINKEIRKDNFLNKVIIFPIIDLSKEGKDLIKQLSIVRFPCYLICKYKNENIFYVLDKFEGVFFLDIFKNTLSPKKNISNSYIKNPNSYKNSSISDNNNPKNNNSNINIKNNFNLFNQNSNLNNKNDIKPNNYNSSPSVNLQQNNNIIQEKKNNNNISNNNNNIINKFNNFNVNNISFPKNINNNFSSLENENNISLYNYLIENNNNYDNKNNIFFKNNYKDEINNNNNYNKNNFNNKNSINSNINNINSNNILNNKINKIIGKEADYINNNITQNNEINNNIIQISYDNNNYYYKDNNLKNKKDNLKNINNQNVNINKNNIQKEELINNYNNKNNDIQKDKLINYYNNKNKINNYIPKDKYFNDYNKENNKKDEPKKEKKEYIPDYRDYDFGEEIIYSPELDQLIKIPNIIDSINNMNNSQIKEKPLTDAEIRKNQDNEMRELERIEENRIKKEKEEKERKKREEQIEREKLEKEKEEKKFFSMLVPKEPDDNNPDKCVIMFRMPNGEKNIERKFLKTDKISVLYDYIRSLGKEIYSEEEYHNFSILQTFPFKNFEDKINNTLEEEGLFPNSVLQIREIN